MPTVHKRTYRQTHRHTCIHREIYTDTRSVMTTMITMKKMICMTPACATWCTKRWIWSWSDCVSTSSSTSSSTMITFSSVHARLVCCRCVYNYKVDAIFENYISQSSVATRFGCGAIFNDSFVANSRVCQWKSFENSLRIDAFIDQPWCTTFWDTVYYHTVSNTTRKYVSAVQTSANLCQCSTYLLWISTESPLCVAESRMCLQ